MYFLVNVTLHFRKQILKAVHKNTSVPSWRKAFNITAGFSAGTDMSFPFCFLIFIILSEVIMIFSEFKQIVHKDYSLQQITLLFQ